MPNDAVEKRESWAHFLWNSGHGLLKSYCDQPASLSLILTSTADRQFRQSFQIVDQPRIKPVQRASSGARSRLAGEASLWIGGLDMVPTEKSRCWQDGDLLMKQLIEKCGEPRHGIPEDSEQKS